MRAKRAGGGDFLIFRVCLPRGGGGRRLKFAYTTIRSPPTPTHSLIHNNVMANKRARSINPFPPPSFQESNYSNSFMSIVGVRVRQRRSHSQCSHLTKNPKRAPSLQFINPPSIQLFTPRGLGGHPLHCDQAPPAHPPPPTISPQNPI